jgi:phosphoribosyl-ATP pyrophosphohydrolase/phosphoribosyl-AMP cyclohydrolase/histidinol dehydrogenase
MRRLSRLPASRALRIEWGGSNMSVKLRRIQPEDAAGASAEPFSPGFLEEVRGLLERVRNEGDRALRELAARFDGLAPSDPLTLGPEGMQAALQGLAPEARGALERMGERVRRFAEAQRAAISDLEVPVEGGRAGHRVRPVARAGCYAPGGRYPLPSSVLMTAVVARQAGVGEVWVASPRPAPATLAAAAVAGADRLLVVGGAPAIGAFAYGTETVPPVDVVVGPGNSWTTAAKQLVSGTVGIDMLAGPSELMVVADGSASAAVVAADLLAQAEHDPEARVGLVALDGSWVPAVEAELERQLSDLPTESVARASLDGQGYAVEVDGLEAAIAVADRVAPEHLQLHLRDAARAAPRFSSYGGLFVGRNAAEVLGDYGIGPNHTLPTAGTARHRGGLSVMDFVTVRTWLELDDVAEAERAVDDAVTVARLEGLEAHARSALHRKGPGRS